MVPYWRLINGSCSWQTISHGITYIILNEKVLMLFGQGLHNPACHHALPPHPSIHRIFAPGVIKRTGRLAVIMPTYLSRECQTADALWCACAGNTRSTCSEPPLIGLCVFHFLTSLLLIFLSCPLPLVIDIHLPLLDSAWFHVYLYLRQWKRPSKLLTEMLIGKIHSIFSGVFWEDMQCTAHINIPDKSMIQDIFHSCYVVIDDSLWGPRCG